MRQFWSRSLTVQFIVLMLLALAASQGVGAVVAWYERSDLLQKQIKSEFVSRAASVAQLLEATPKELQDDILAATATNYSRFWVSPAPPTEVADWRGEAFRQLTLPLPSYINLGSPEKLRTAPPNEALLAAAKASTSAQWSELSSSAWPLDRTAKFVRLDDAFGMGLAVRLTNGSWLNTAFAKPAANAFWTQQAAASIGFAALLLCAIAVVLVRGITRPMRRMADAAEALGRGERVELAETGPDDIRQTAEAFNRMQDRLQRFVEDRTRMLAAIGHDLRTPITSLRLRAEFVSDEETREKMLATLDELRGMTEASLAFAREEAVEEETRAVDLTALVESLCDDLRELGQEVVFLEGARIRTRCRPDSLRRAVRNLVENASRYAGGARVSVFETAQAIAIDVEDDGPGVPKDALEQVFAPFYRLEVSRNRETGGVGLGLAIARSIARRHGGDVVLENLDKGLRARITLPQARVAGESEQTSAPRQRRAALPAPVTSPAAPAR
ncbi:ATP-binding protein [Chenggangzhangella methanolivorans]|uniref:histidine kinase n=1 Tax=Chenggangzhangella methanolivorans TaxID=1437009 RepID=A0A9E6REU4_9HYPH|nr:HAMP domain-containing protein [Chenggangzhangella methanolivorans]